VITAALNPSQAEFPESDRLLRFRRAEGARSTDLEIRYLSALGAYFREDPYQQWFGSFEPILQGMGASFYPTRGHTALHTDLCTPLATIPTWGGLPKAVKSRLLGPGQRTWHRLVEYLQPDVILLSVAEQHLRSIRFLTVQPPRPVFTVRRDNPYVVTVSSLCLASGRVVHLVFGRAAQTPFGLISHDDKRAVGTAVLRKVHGE
jgi:hypothetical protein